MQRYRSAASPVKIVNLHRESLRDLAPTDLDRAVEERVAVYRDVWLARDGGSG